MYVWIGALFPDDLDHAIDDELKIINKNLGLSETILDFPEHISLKIIFNVLRPDGLKERIERFFSHYQAFYIETKRVERNADILWIRLKDNPILDEIHQALDAIMKIEYNVFPQELDSRFIFHSTLFIDENVEKIKQMYDIIKDHYQDMKIPIDRIVYGFSESSDPYSFTVDNIISLKKNNIEA